MQANTTEIPENAIAVIGMDCRFPKANSTEEYWDNLVKGKECITFLSDDELRRAGVSEETIHNPNYVRAAGLIDGADLFDAGFFGYTPTEAMHMDPQQCLFLETCWHALEDAGYNPYTYPGAVAVFGGTRLSTYYVNFMAADLAEYGTARFMQSHIGTDRDHLCTRISYKLNLRGPAFTVQCACSTSLVALHLGCQGLLNGECDMAIAGASGIDIPQEHGHFYQEGMIFAPDGHCRPYDAAAEGIVSGNGVGAVLLKRLEDAIEDRDSIHAVILGTAINNDGSSKVAYSAPSFEGQSEVIAEALGVSGVDPASIAYVEGHGTGTYLGDPLEVEALNRIYSHNNPKKQYCALGSVKSNVGHLEVVAGVASFIKAVMTLKKGRIAPTCHYKTPNPRIHFEETPFFVNNTAIDWPADMTPRRAAVSSFGVGGTNAHVILQEAPARGDSVKAGAAANRLLVLSARGEKPLRELAESYCAFLDSAGDSLDLTDMCNTTQEGRAHHATRLAVTAENRAGDPLVEWRYTNNPDKNVDLLWGVAPAGFSYTNVSGGTTSVPVGKPLLNLVKPDKDQKVKFLFQHALSRIGLSVVSAIDQIAAGDDAGVFNNAQTRVLIKNVQVFGDFGIQGVLNLNNTVANKAEWVAASIDKSDDADPAPLFWFDNGVAIGSAAPFNNVANSYIAPNLRYDQTQINAVTATAGSFAGVNTGVLPSEQPLLAGGADPGKKVKDPTFEYNKPYFTESAGTFTLATATAENADGFTYNSISDVYTQVQKTGGTPVTLNGYSAKHYKITATDAGSGTSVTDTKYYTLTGTVGSGDAVYTLALVGDGTTAIPASSYTLAPTALGATYATGDYYPAQPRYFMVIPTGNTPIKVKITYAVVTYDKTEVWLPQNNE